MLIVTVMMYLEDSSIVVICYFTKKYSIIFRLLKTAIGIWISAYIVNWTLRTHSLQEDCDKLLKLNLNTCIVVTLSVVHN